MTDKSKIRSKEMFPKDKRVNSLGWTKAQLQISLIIEFTVREAASLELKEEIDKFTDIIGDVTALSNWEELHLSLWWVNSHKNTVHRI